MNSEERAMKAVDELCNVAMRGFVEAMRGAAMDAAKRRLGDEKFYAVAIPALRASMKLALCDKREENMKALASGAGSYAAQAILAGVVADAVNAVLAA